MVKQYLSVKGAAEYLGVDYKTVYRLVRKGEIPAGRVGDRGTYRILKEDIDAYFEQQKRRAVKEKAQPGTAQTKCAVCLRLLSDGSEIGGLCAVEGCDAPICATCWRAEVHYCLAHRPSRADQLALARAQLAAGEIPLLVTALEARQREMGFISRFDQKVHRIVKLRHPISDSVLHPPHPWSQLHASLDESERLMDLLRTGYLDRETEKEMPLNVISRYVIPAGGPRQPGLILEARVLSHLPFLVRQGFDTRPATQAELLRVLQECIETAEAQNVAYLIGIAATTGWVAEARAYVEASGEGRSFSHRLVLPCLVDLHRMTLVYNRSDQRIAPLASLFEPRLPEEQVLAVMEHIRRELHVYSSLTLAEVAEQTKAAPDVVQAATERLAATNGFRVVEIEGIGRAISVQTTEV